MALAEAALDAVDEVVLVMPRSFPHKSYEGVGLAERIALVRQAVDARAGFSVAITEGGLFIDIARECRADYGDDCRFWFICGRDAAERIVGWDYGDGATIGEQLREFGLLVADRQGEYAPPAEHGSRIQRLAVPGDWDEVSATAIRDRIRSGADWASLVPEQIAGKVERLYGRSLTILESRSRETP